MAERLVAASEVVISRARVERGETVVDVATGSGNAALLAAACGADVIGIDFEPSLLAVAADRAQRLGLVVRWTLADVTDTGLADGCADVVTSVFGVMFAPDALAASRELARVCAPRARVVLASWRPGSFIPSMGAALSGFLAPPPAGSTMPSSWGDADSLATILSGGGLDLVEATTEQLTLSFSDANEATQFLLRTAGHLEAARASLIAQGRWNDLVAALSNLVSERGRVGHGRFDIVGDFLVATARRSL